MRRSFKLSFTIGFVSALLLAQGCAQDIKSKGIPLSQRNAVPASSAGAAPAGNSIAAAGSGLIGTFVYKWDENFGCVSPSFGFLPQVPDEETAYDETLIIEDRRVTMIDTFPSTGCTINFVFALRGVDATRLSLQGAQISAFVNGSPDTSGTCAQHYSADLPSRVLTYDYVSNGYQVMLLTSPYTEYCRSDEKTAFVYYRVY
ncbi:MAG: hypothetical protein NDJ90_09945 [Oligoflexia bacterium]|nr:hypothetical protein [Oligoflexia bacterium]